MIEIGERNNHWAWYLMKVIEVAEGYINPQILKMDAYNELLDVPIDGGIANNVPGAKFTVLEFETLYARKVERMYPNLRVVLGDIRKLPFKKETFDIIADLSTIDHVSVKSLPQVFKGYDRVLKPGGKAIIIAWLTNNPMVSDETERRHQVWQSISQYFFPYTEFSNLLQEHFNIISTEPVPETGEEGDTWLNCFVVGKK